MPREELDDAAVDRFGRVYTRSAAARRRRTSCPSAAPEPRRRGPASGRRAGRRRDPARLPHADRAARVLLAARSPSGAGRSTRCPTYIQQPRAPRRARRRMRWCSSPTFRLPTQIHTRCGNAKWLNELAHTNPLWIHPQRRRAARRVRNGRPRPGGDRDRLLRRQGMGDRGHPAGRRGLQPPHGPLAARRRRRAAPAPRPPSACASDGRWLGDAPRAAVPAVRIR